MRGIKTKESGKWKRICVFCVLLVVFGVLLNSARKVYEKKTEAQAMLSRMEKEFADLKNRQEFLASSLQKLGTADGIAFEMRKKLNVAGAGESVAIIVDQSKPASTPPAPLSSWQKFKNFFVELFE
jgi:cell division protein FtsB